MPAGTAKGNDQAYQIGTKHPRQRKDMSEPTHYHTLKNKSNDESFRRLQYHTYILRIRSYA